MDPDQALKDLRSKLDDVQRAVDNDKAIPEVTLSEALDIWHGLDEWLTKGGFYPKDWRPRP